MGYTPHHADSSPERGGTSFSGRRGGTGGTEGASGAAGRGVFLRRRPWGGMAEAAGGVSPARVRSALVVAHVVFCYTYME
ncbi:MAG: hypothetical protein LBI86_06490 [Treponema sp.]|nr:hypothetical protein [Treponema sp.]